MNRQGFLFGKGRFCLDFVKTSIGLNLKLSNFISMKKNMELHETRTSPKTMNRVKLYSQLTNNGHLKKKL